MLAKSHASNDGEIIAFGFFDSVSVVLNCFDVFEMVRLLL